MSSADASKKLAAAVGERASSGRPGAPGRRRVLPVDKSGEVGHGESQPERLSAGPSPWIG